MVRLARAAHRLQAWSVLIVAATEAMKIMPATERLLLHRELGLESAHAQQMEEINRRHQVSNARAVARGLPERNFTPPAPPDVSWSFETVFSEVVKTTSLTLPVEGLDDKLNLQLALACAALWRKRYSQPRALRAADPISALIRAGMSQRLLLANRTLNLLEAIAGPVSYQSWSDDRDLVRKFCVHTKSQ